MTWFHPRYDRQETASLFGQLYEVDMMTGEAGSGAGSRLPTPLLVVSGLCTVVAVLVSAMSILLQLRNYRKPALQRMVVRIMLMVPLYAIASLISLFSVEAAFFIDAIRDIYEAFVIYCFFVLLVSYLGGERSLLILLHGRPPKDPVFPVNIFKSEIDVSDPHTFLFLKRGILQYVQVKPALAAATLILKVLGKYNEGDFRANSGYLYISIIYNFSICLSLYCLAVFWMCVNDDLKPFRPVPKFLCVKGILFFSFWQSVGISTLVAAKVITRLGPYTDPENVSVGLNDLLICMEMPFFAFAHMYAFAYTDFIDPTHTFVARMPMYYAFRDAFGPLDVIEDSKATLRGEGMDYREFEPAEGVMHQGAGRDRRIRAGLRYSKGGQRKYWLPKTTDETRPPGRAERVMKTAIGKFTGRDARNDEVRAPLLEADAESVVHLAPDMQDVAARRTLWDGDDGADDGDDGYALPFGEPDPTDDALFAHSRQYLFGDYHYPCVDVSTEAARTVIWVEEERVLRDERGAWFSPLRGAQGTAAIQQRVRPAWSGYGAVGSSAPVTGPGRASPASIHDTREGNTIDHEQARSVVPSRAGDVQLDWTNTRARAGGNTLAAQVRSAQQRIRRGTPSASPGSASPASGSGSGGGSPAARHSELRVSPVISRRNSRTVAGSPVLPPDAVDLVVEDPHAAEEDQTRERRKGEPAARGSGLRRMYRRGFENEAGDGEVEVDGADDGLHVDTGEQVADTLGEEEDRKEDGRAPRHDSEWNHESEGVIATSTTPPVYARIQTTPYDISEHDNPWAS